MLELLFRIFIQETDYSTTRDSNFIQLDSLLSYRYASNLDTTLITLDYSIDIRTNSYGFRDKEWDTDTSFTNILILGNSFSAGFGINNESRWWDLIEKSLSHHKHSIRVYNAAVSGFSVNQAIDNGIELSELIQPKITIVGFYLNSLDRIDDPFQYYEGFSVKRSAIPYAKVTNDELLFSFWKSEPIKTIEIYFKQNSVLYQFIEQRVRYNLLPRIRESLISSNETEQPEQERPILSKKAFEELIELKKSVSAEIYLLPIIQHNRDFEIFENQKIIYRELKSLSMDSEIHFIDILPEFESQVLKGTDMWINSDAHWNETAHTLAAEIIIIDLLKN